MAKYDHGGGCPCGLKSECNCGIEEQPMTFVPVYDPTRGNPSYPPLKEVKYPTPSVDKGQPVKSNGWSTSYYEIPEGCKELQDLIEFRNFNFAEGNMFKAIWRLGAKEGTDRAYDLRKIIWFAQRELDRAEGKK